MFQFTKHIVVGIVAGIAFTAVIGILAWQYFGVPKEKVEIPQEEKIIEIPREEERVIRTEEQANVLPLTFDRLDFSRHQAAAQFRTVINSALKRGPNFAWNYIIVEWGCSTNCVWGAIIDTKTGIVYEIPASNYVFHFGYKYSVDSNILMVEQPGEQFGSFPFFVEHYMWKDNRFELIEKVIIPH